MVRLRELASLTLLAMGAMLAVIWAGAHELQPIAGGVRFHFAGTKVIRLASNERHVQIEMGPGREQMQPLPLAPIDPAIANVGQAMGRLHARVPDDLYPYFDLYLYVSKAANGPLAQRMYIFRKDASGDIAFEQTFLVSTGRERYEKYFTTTPTGLFELDPDRFKRSHYSRTWHAQMPWAMFLNATIRGRQTGIALHSASSHVAQLGSRASGGCVRLPPEKAAELFERFQREERGYVPLFAFDASLNRTDPYGRILRDASGRPVMQYGYKVLLIIEDYRGTETLVAALV
jgi:hypothetical protein